MQGEMYFGREEWLCHSEGGEMCNVRVCAVSSVAGKVIGLKRSEW